MSRSTAALDNYSGMRPLGDVLEQDRVIRAYRELSLAEPPPEPPSPPEPQFVYAIRDKQVVELPFVKFTPKFVRFNAGATTAGGPWHCYANRQSFEHGRPAEVHGCGRNGIGSYVYLTREIAEQALIESQRPWTRARAKPEEARIIRSAHHALDARGGGKDGPHSTGEACRIIRDLLDVLAAMTGIDSATDTLL